MKTKEYISGLKDLNENQIHPEFHAYTTVWMKTHLPSTYSELKAAFNTIESEIYAAHECEDARQPF